MLIFDQLKRNDFHLRLLSVVVLCVMGVLLVGLWYVQIVSARDYRANLENQSYRTVRVPAVRGQILDRNGIVLAGNRPAYNVGLYIEELSPEFQSQFSRALKYYREELNQKLTRTERVALGRRTRYQVASNVVTRLGSSLAMDVSLQEEVFQKHYTNNLFVPLPILDDLDTAQVARFQEQSNIPPGLDLDIQPMRTYPMGRTAAHLIGYLKRDKSSVDGEVAYFNYRPNDYRGLVGIEAAYDEHLRGTAGAKSILVNHLGYRQSETVWANAEPGHNVVLTLDIPIQRAAEQALLRNGPLTRGAVVVMDPRTGDILALASSPGFDPAQFLPRISHEEYAKLQDPHLLPLINRATYGIYAPGSIYKIITGLAALETGALDPRDKIKNPGHYQLGRRRIDDTAPPGDYDLARALKRSSNTYFIHHALKPGVHAKMVELGERLHLGERTGTIPGQDAAGQFPNAKIVAAGWHPGDTANLAIGQGPIAVTPMQMAVMMSAVANGGKVLWPRVVDRVEPADPSDSEQTIRFPTRRVRDELGVNPQHLHLMRQALLGVVADSEEGSGKESFVPGMDVAGKTGTAQVTQGRRVVDHVTWFASFAPWNTPRYVVVVMVQSGSSGGGTCAPIARHIYQALQKREQMGEVRPPALAGIK